MGNRQHTVVQPYCFITNICVLRPMERNRGRWNRERWHQRGTRLNEDVRAWLNRGSSEQSSVQTTGRERRYATMSNIRRRVMHFRTASFVRRLGSIAVTYKRRRRAQPVLPTSSAEADSAVNSSRYAQLEFNDFCRGLLTLDTTDLCLHSRLTPCRNCCRRRRNTIQYNTKKL